MVIALQDWLDLMGEWPMADVMEKRKGLKQTCFIRRKPLDSAEALRKGEHADSVFKTCMDGARKDQVVDSQLPAATKTLKVRMFHDGKEIRNVRRWRRGNADGLSGNHGERMAYCAKMYSMSSVVRSSNEAGASSTILWKRLRLES